MKNLLDDLTGWAGIYLTDPAVNGLASFDYKTHDISRELFFFSWDNFSPVFFFSLELIFRGSKNYWYGARRTDRTPSGAPAYNVVSLED